MKFEEEFENILQALYEYGEAVKDLYQKRLLSDDKKATGNLINTVETYVNYQGMNFLVTLSLQDYWKYVEGGRKPGKFPPPQKIKDWIQAKHILPTPMANGKLPTEEQLAFLISRKIATEGIKAGHQLAETVEDINRIYLPKLQEALQKDFDAYAIKAFTDVGKMIRI